MTTRRSVAAQATGAGVRAVAAVLVVLAAVAAVRQVPHALEATVAAARVAAAVLAAVAALTGARVPTGTQALEQAAVLPGAAGAATGMPAAAARTAGPMADRALRALATGLAVQVRGGAGPAANEDTAASEDTAAGRHAAAVPTTPGGAPRRGVAQAAGDGRLDRARGGVRAADLASSLTGNGANPGADRPVGRRDLPSAAAAAADAARPTGHRGRRPAGATAMTIPGTGVLAVTAGRRPDTAVRPLADIARRAAAASAGSGAGRKKGAATTVRAARSVPARSPTRVIPDGAATGSVIAAAATGRTPVSGALPGTVQTVRGGPEDSVTTSLGPIGAGHSRLRAAAASAGTRPNVSGGPSLTDGRNDGAPRPATPGPIGETTAATGVTHNPGRVPSALTGNSGRAARLGPERGGHRHEPAIARAGHSGRVDPLVRPASRAAGRGLKTAGPAVRA